MNKQVLLGIGIVCLIAIALLISGGRASERRQQFDAARWKEGDLSRRASMVNDLVERKLLHNKGVPEVLDALGTPDHRGSNFFLYVVEAQRPSVFFPMSDRLLIYFDDENHVTTVQAGD